VTDSIYKVKRIDCQLLRYEPLYSNFDRSLHVLYIIQDSNFQASKKSATKETILIVKLAEYIEYQKGTVVSKVIMKSGRGNVTLFAFSIGEELSEHTAPFDALVQCLEGEVEIALNGDLNILNEGDFIIIPADTPHAVKAITDFKMLLTIIKK
jgi:quercetin dioxygenase-like cupin family protein